VELTYTYIGRKSLWREYRGGRHDSLHVEACCLLEWHALKTPRHECQSCPGTEGHMLCHSAVDPSLDTLSSPLRQHFFAFSMKYARLSHGIYCSSLLRHRVFNQSRNTIQFYSSATVLKTIFTQIKVLEDLQSAFNVTLQTCQLVPSSLLDIGLSQF
jgi:hypothetical protein